MKFKTLVFYFLFLTFSVSAFQESSTQKFKDSMRIEIGKLLSDSLKAQKYYNASFYAMQRLNDLRLSRVYADSSLYYAEISNFKDSEAKSHFQFGVIERIEGNYKLALQHLDTNIKYFKEDSLMVPYAMFQVGIIHRKLGDYNKSLKTYLDVLNIFESRKDSFAIASALNSIGNIYGEMKKPDKAIENFNEALIIFQQKKSQRNVANAHENIGKMYLLKKDTISARHSIKNALKISRLINEDFEIAKTLHSLGNTYLNSNPNEAFKYFLEAEKLLNKIEFERYLIPVYRDIGSFYKKKKHYKKSLEYYEKSLKLAQDLKEKPYQKDAFKGLFEVYGAVGDYKKAFINQTEYIAIKDSLFDKESQKELSQLQTKFESSKKDKAIIKQQLLIEQNENELQKKKDQYKFMTGIAFLLLLISALIWLVFNQRQKRKNQELKVLKNEAQINSLESLIEGEEKERLRIAKELHDGVNGDLSAIKFKLTSMQEMSNKIIDEAVEMIDKSCKQVRAISHNLIPPSLESFNIVEATETFCQNMNSIHKPQINFQHIGDTPKINKKNEINMFRIIQELVTNSIKHADANEIDVQLSCREKQIQITVEDNGKGFDAKNPKNNGIGLQNIQSRVEYLQATIDVISNSRGTSYTIEIDTTKLNDN